MSFNKKNALFTIFLLVGFFLPIFFVFSDNLDALTDEQLCESTVLLDQKCDQMSTEECNALLQTCQKYFEEKKEEIEAELAQTSQEKKTLQDQIYVLYQKVQNLEYQIYQSNISIKSLGYQIDDTEISIENTAQEIEEQKEKITLILRSVEQEDKRSIVEILLSSSTISEFFDNLVYLETLNIKNQEMLSNFEDLKNYLESQMVKLEDEKAEYESLVAIQSYQKEESLETKNERQYYLGLTEAEYQSQLEEKEGIEKKAAEIEARIFSLVGVEVGEAPTFGEALLMAKTVAGSVNIRAAFLLAIISQESAIGRNVGQCYVTNKTTGSGVYSNGNPVNRIMHTTRDLPIFLQITGDNYNKMPVSCWIPDCVKVVSGSYYHCSASVNSNGDPVCYYSGYVPYGFGGAMGPAQFIPSTWKLYEDKIKLYTGHSTANPWDIEDSFTASALYLYDLGAKTTSGEFSAASRYYGGSSSYASQVATRAWCIQQFIDNGSMSSRCEQLIF